MNLLPPGVSHARRNALGVFAAVVVETVAVLAVALVFGCWIVAGAPTNG